MLNEINGDRNNKLKQTYDRIPKEKMFKWLCECLKELHYSFIDDDTVDFEGMTEAKSDAYKALASFMASVPNEYSLYEFDGLNMSHDEADLFLNEIGAYDD